MLLRSTEGYRAYLEEAFNRAGIPAHFAPTAPPLVVPLAIRIALLIGAFAHPEES